VILLGEQGHYDLSTTEVKGNMVKELMKLGFTTIAIEVPSIITPYVYSQKEFSSITASWDLETIMNSPWTRQEEFKPVLELIKNKTLKLTGIDVNIRDYDFEAVQLLLEKYSAGESFNFDWNKFIRLFYKLAGDAWNNHDSLSFDDQVRYMTMVDDISNRVDYLILKNGPDPDLKAIKQWLRAVNRSFFEISAMPFAYYETDMRSIVLSLSNDQRDASMADNVLWHLEHFPKEKIIIWCANFHAAKDISQTRYHDNSLDYYYQQLMGEHLYNKLGNEIYSLAFTSSNNSGEEHHTLGGLEKEISEVIGENEFAFINFRPLRFEPGYRDCRLETEFMRKKYGRWLNIYDGVYYIEHRRTNYVKPE